MEAWRRLGVGGHLEAKRPWLPYHEFLTAYSAEIVNALDTEVVVMNSLSVNLHLLMVSFYRPKGKRKKILIEHHAFPSDRYAIHYQLKFHGNHQDEDLIITITKKTVNDKKCAERVANAGSKVINKKSFKLRDKLEQIMKKYTIEFRRGNAGGGNQLRQPYLKKYKPKNFKEFINVEHVHSFGYYIGNYPDLFKQKINQIIKVLNSLND